MLTEYELRARLNQIDGFAQGRARAFLGGMFPLRDFYDKKLRDNNEIDFDGNAD